MINLVLRKVLNIRYHCGSHGLSRALYHITWITCTWIYIFIGWAYINIYLINV